MQISRRTALLGAGAAAALAALPHWLRVRLAATVTAPVAHTVVVMLENADAAHAYASPTFAGLAKSGAHSTAWFEFSYPSAGNYLAGAFGQVLQKADTPITQYAQQTIFDLAHAAGVSAYNYAENLPANPTQDAKPYIAHHVPLAFSPSGRAHGQLVDLKALDPNNLPTLAWVTPNATHQGHPPSTLAQCDSWVKAWAPTILGGGSFTRDGGLLILVWDTPPTNSGAPVACIVAGSHAKPGAVSAVKRNHLNLCGTLLWAAGLPPLAQSSTSATDMTA